MVAPLRTQDRTPTRSTIEGSAGQSCEGWQYTFEVRGQVSRTFNTTGPDRNGSRTKNGNDDATSGLRATTKSSTPRPQPRPNPPAGHRQVCQVPVPVSQVCSGGSLGDLKVIHREA